MAEIEKVEADISPGDVRTISHSVEAIERHRIDEDYVWSLIDAIEVWNDFGDEDGRLSSIEKRDGVFWKVVVEPNRISVFDASYDLITVYPWEVNEKEALGAGRWGRIEVLDLAFYADRNG